MRGLNSCIRRNDGVKRGGLVVREHRYWCYLMASGRNGTLYLGVTSNLVQRVQQHREKFVAGFTRDHDVTMLVWYEEFAWVQDAIACEKRLKKWRRGWKVELIEGFNPLWDDLCQVIVQ